LFEIYYYRYKHQKTKTNEDEYGTFSNTKNIDRIMSHIII